MTGQRQPDRTAEKIGTTRAADPDTIPAPYGLRCPLGCGQIHWRNTKPLIAPNARLTQQARVRCRHCATDFRINIAKCTICNLRPADCRCMPPNTNNPRWTEPPDALQVCSPPRTRKRPKSAKLPKMAHNTTQLLTPSTRLIKTTRPHLTSSRATPPEPALTRRRPNQHGTCSNIRCSFKLPNVKGELKRHKTREANRNMAYHSASRHIPPPRYKYRRWGCHPHKVDRLPNHGRQRS